MSDTPRHELDLLDDHLEHLRKIANKRLKVLRNCGCFFCGRIEPLVTKQYLFGEIVRIPVCTECDEKEYNPQWDDYSKLFEIKEAEPNG